MRLRFLALVCLLLVPVSATAQAHPCDVPPTPGGTFSGRIKVQWCSDGLDVNGQPTTVTQVKIYIDGYITPTLTQAPVLVTTTANAAGLKLYETAYFTLTKGSHTVAAALVNATGTGGLSSPAFPFTIADGLPSLPNNLRISK